MNEKLLNQLMGFVLIMLVVVANFIFVLKGFFPESASWGFVNGVIVTIGLFKLGGQ